jgi:hypothetical protein
MALTVSRRPVAIFGRLFGPLEHLLHRLSQPLRDDLAGPSTRLAERQRRRAPARTLGSAT